MNPLEEMDVHLSDHPDRRLETVTYFDEDWDVIRVKATLWDEDTEIATSSGFTFEDCCRGILTVTPGTDSWYGSPATLHLRRRAREIPFICEACRCVCGFRQDPSLTLLPELRIPRGRTPCEDCAAWGFNVHLPPATPTPPV